MAIFDVYIEKINDYIGDLRDKGRQFREYSRPGSADDLMNGLPVKVGPNAGSGIVLRSDTFIELGNPEIGSSSFLLWTDNPSLINNGRITLIGPDIPESQGQSLPFGQVLLIGGASLSDADHELMERSQYVADQIEGYMLKSLPQRSWSRVSNEAAAKGFNLEILGRAIMAILKSAVPGIEAIEILFVTSGKEDVESLGSLGEQVREISYNLTRETWKAKGYDIECFSALDCGSCPDSAVCDEIREIVNIRKKEKDDASEE